MRKFNKRWLLIPLILLAAVGGFVVWASIPSGTLMAEAQAALQSDGTVQVDDSRWLVFTPVDEQPETGFIFYPGGRVLAEAYAPMASHLAADGYLVVLVPMPLNLAVFEVNAANDVVAAYPEIEDWALGGHSLGGAMAANYVKANPGKMQGLVLLASYPQAGDTLAEAAYDDLVVASVYGTLDGLAEVESIENSRQYLPANTTFVAIDGGNHAQFGWYGDQAGDNPAQITREAQQEQVYEAVQGVLVEINRS